MNRSIFRKAHAILPERKNIPLPLRVTTTRRRMIKAQGTSVSKWSRSKAPAGARPIRRPREFSLIIAQVLPGGARHPPRWVKCTQIRKHESRFYRRPEVPLKYPHRANERAMGNGRRRRRNESSGGRQLVLSPLSLASQRLPLREILPTIRSARGNLRNAHEISQISFETFSSLSLLLLPVSLYVVVAALTVTGRSFYGGIDSLPASIDAPG